MKNCIWFIFVIMCLKWSDIDATCEQFEYTVHCNFEALYKPHQYLLAVNTKHFTHIYPYRRETYINSKVSVTSSYIPLLDDTTFSVQINNVTMLSIKYSEILNVTSLRNFQDIETVDLSNNNLTHLYADIFYGMQSLNLSYNFIEKVDNRSIQSADLHILDLSYNRLNCVNNILHGNEELLELYLSHNNISINVSEASPFRFLEKLNILDLSDNCLKLLNVSIFANNRNLLKLDLSGNSLDNLPFRIFHNMNKLNNLNISRNKIKVVDIWFFIGLKSLVNVNLNENGLRLLDCDAFHNTPILKSMHINKKSVKTVDTYKLIQYTDLKLIDLEYNNIDCLKLLDIISTFEKYEIVVKEGSENETLAVHGISCKYDSMHTQILETSSSKSFKTENPQRRNHNDKVEFILDDLIKNTNSSVLQKTLIEDATRNLTERYDKLFILFNLCIFVLVFILITLIVLVYKVLNPVKPIKEYKEMQVII